jgi:hypothetical protein
MSEDTTTITRDRAITLINDSIENFATYYDSYCCDNRDSLSDEERELYQEMSEVTYILRNDADYANDLKIMPLEHLTQFLYMCKEMVENNDLFTKYSYPKGNIVIVENQEKKTYEKGWIIVLKNDKPIKIVNNSGMDIIFVNSQGTITSTVKYETGSYTEFFGKNIGLSKAEANSLFIKANYTWTNGKMIGGYKAFDLQGKEVEPTIDGNTIEVKKEVTEAPKQKDGGSSIVSSKISNRIPQNDLRPSSPNGPCLFRALLAAAEEKIGQAFTLNEMNTIKKNCSKKDSKYIGNEEDEFFVNKHAQVIKAALTFKGYKNATVTWSSPRKSTVSGNSDYTIRFIKSKGHFQLGDKDGNLLWEPYKYNNPANAYTGKADGFNEITISLGAKE